jgi:hypothetical protein
VVAVGLRDRLGRIWSTAGGEPRPDGAAEVAVGDPAYDDWDVVGDFEDLETARAFRQVLTEQGLESVITSDWPLDRWGRGDIALRVPAGQGLDAEELLDSD